MNISKCFKWHIHDYEEIKYQITKNICFGLGNCHGLRVVEQCKKCGKLRYIKLNLSMPDSYLYRECIWK